MSNLVIVAIPDENDRVWKVSSEKIPHLTLLFLGDADEVANPDQIVQFVEHAANTTLKRFYLPVDHRGELGEDKADVLFFKQGRYDFKAVYDFRSQLLQDDNIKTAYDSTAQHEGPWKPHLTLGYPETPAKSENEDWGSIYSVDFNKIAVWFGDYEGPDFLLKDYWDEFESLQTVPVDVAMSGIMIHGADEYEQNLAMGEAFLAHYGKKGMKWGVRNDRHGRDRFSPEGHSTKGDIAKFVGSAFVPVAGYPLMVPPGTRLVKRLGGQQGQSSKEDKKDVKFERKADSASVKRKILRKSGDHIANDVEAIRGKSDYKDKNLKADPKLKDKYDKEVAAAVAKRLTDGANSMKNASGTRQYDVKTNGDKWNVTTREVKHADGDEAFTLVITRDDKGFIVGIEVGDVSMAQAAEVGADFLEHYGVKGMHWGVRKAGSAAKATGRFIGDVHFEAQTARGPGGEASKATNMVASAARKPFKKEDLPAVKARHGDYGKMTKRATKPFSKEARAYRKDARETYVKRLETEANKMKNVSGDRQYTVRERGIDKPAQGGDLPKSKYVWEVTARDVKHAATSPDLTLEVIMDSEGWITDVVPVETDLAQSTTDIGEAFVIEHFGVKGMKWGVRREAPSAVGATAASHVPHGNRRKTKIKVEGGQNHPASDDALKVAEARGKLKKSGVSTLSNKELQDVAKRLQLETQVAQLTSSRGQKFITRQLEQTGQQTFQTGVRTYGPSVAKKTAKKAGKTAAKLAVGAALL